MTYDAAPAIEAAKPAKSKTAIPVGLNMFLVSGVVIFHLVMLVALPFLLAQSLWWALLLPALAIVNNTHWALIHEAIHKILHPTLETNERLGRMLGILMGASLPVLRFGHLMHHQMNRDWHSEWVEERSLRSKAAYYWHLLFGLYAAEVATALAITFLPRKQFIALAARTATREHPQVTVAGERFLYVRGNAKTVREDMILSIALFATAAWHFGAYWPALLGFFLLRGLTVSFMDNIYHYGTPADNSKAGKELLLPKYYSRLFLNGNYHETHHLNPNIPWTRLPETHNNQGRVFNGDFVSHGLQQFSGPLMNYA